jgi:hypothetical protein
MTKSTLALLSAVLLVGAGAGGAVSSFAKDGADDPPGDDRGGQTTGTTTTGGTTTSDDDSGDDDGGRRGDDGEVRKSGKCTGRSTSKLKAKRDDGRLEVEFEVDQNRNDVVWKVKIQRNGRTAASGNGRTRAPSGSFSFERRIAGTSGTIAARATSPGGEVCKATVSV